jgi:hypothetical protein
LCLVRLPIAVQTAGGSGSTGTGWAADSGGSRKFGLAADNLVSVDVVWAVDFRSEVSPRGKKNGSAKKVS